MKKIIIMSCALVLLTSYSANAEVNLNIDLGQPVVAEPVVVQQAPAYVVERPYPQHIDRNHHNYDWKYWHDHHDDHDHDRDHDHH